MEIILNTFQKTLENLENCKMNPSKISDIKWNISLLEDIQESVMCQLEGWDTAIEMTINNLKDYVRLLENTDDSNS